MNVFQYLTTEEKRIQKTLEKLIDVIGTIEHERTFEQTNKITTAITGHLKMEEDLLIEPASQVAALSEIAQEAEKDREKVLDEIGQLTQVHIDEPDFRPSLKKLHAVMADHCHFLDNFFAELKLHLSVRQLKQVNEKLNDKVFESAEFGQVETKPATHTPK